MDSATFSQAMAALDGVGNLIAFILRQIERARERGELTPEEEAAANAKLEAVTSQSHWQKR